jgi:hypothetical protein
MTRMTRRLEPNLDNRGLYDAAYGAYVRLHPAISPIVAGLARAASTHARPVVASGLER